MQLDAERYEREKAFMGKFWTFRKDYGTPEGDDRGDEYWGNVMGAWDSFKDLCGEDPYCYALLFTCIADLESRYRKMYGKPDFEETLNFFNSVGNNLNDGLRRLGVKVRFEKAV